MHTGRREADDEIAGRHTRPVDQRRTVDEADAARGEIEFLFAIDARQLRRLAADQRAPCGAAYLRSALDQFRDLLEIEPVRGDVVEQEQRIGPGRRDVVDAVRGHVHPAVPQRAAATGDGRLRPDRVERGRQQAIALERVQARECAESFGPGRFHGRTQAVDDGAGRRQRDPSRLVARHCRESKLPACRPR